MISSSPSAPNSRSTRYTAFIVRRAHTVLILAAFLFAGAVLLASRLELHTSISELLPSNDPGVVALTETQRRMGDLTLLLIGIHSPDREANLRYADDLTKKLLALPPSVLSLATYHVRDFKAFFEGNKWLYVGEKDLGDIRDRIRNEITKRKNPLLVDLSDDEESVEDLRKRITDQDKLGGRFPGGVLTNAEGTYVWIAALPPGGLFGEKTGEGLYQAAERLIKELDPKTYHPELVARPGGPIASAIIARAAVESDILWVTICCAIVVSISIGLYFRRLRAVPFVGIPAVMGTIMAFAVAELAFGYVNSSTAFLGSIILGNGINYSIILMARYQEERAAGRSLEEALADALAGVVSGTAVAALCASGAYASLMLTSFRGFFQFGVMGAAGVLACWVATFTVLPALFVVLDRRASKRPVVAPFHLAWLGRVLTRRASMLLVLSVVATLLSVRGLIHFSGAPFEYDFRKLNVRTNTSEEAQNFAASSDDLFGRWPQPYIVLADRIEDVEAIGTAIRKQDDEAPGPPTIKSVISIYDLLPGTPQEQNRKIEILKDIRKLVNDPDLSVLTEKERKQLKDVDPPADMRQLLPSDLPPLVRRPFTEADGTIGRVVLVYYVGKGISIWNGRDLLRIRDILQEIKLPDGRVLHTSGNAVVFSAMLRSILRDGPIATVASLLAVLLVILLAMRPLRAGVMTICSLLMGVVWMVGAAGWGDVKITFLNFIALPITFGIGAEYASNVIARYYQKGDIVRAVTSTGAAVALCSWTTIVGYGSLLAARNRALQGFGAMAILGEVACLLAAVVALPSLILWREQRGKKSGEATASSEASPL